MVCICLSVCQSVSLSFVYVCVRSGADSFICVACPKNHLIQLRLCMPDQREGMTQLLSIDGKPLLACWQQAGRENGKEGRLKRGKWGATENTQRYAKLKEKGDRVGNLKAKMENCALLSCDGS
ncbi:hypothetical protein BKA57DRAFT_179393 [Linnemannia elongata]|nr:hypothetical protein BKA57DRAFT_179393 [Linnemannia elongata]